MVVPDVASGPTSSVYMPALLGRQDTPSSDDTKIPPPDVLDPAKRFPELSVAMESTPAPRAAGSHVHRKAAPADPPRPPSPPEPTDPAWLPPPAPPPPLRPAPPPPAALPPSPEPIAPAEPEPALPLTP